ncbi:WecB/TagA/CpsF family glycosyltransferase [Thermosediminibacter oceani]|uniref:N-acetylglucosaminyldiphosphoundecaprenol N-acetyl-beta-D-mannosaminyltransferase n=1 Tax=Thermosediminibacter oceani (strain ATCC BAA-1034 / DSM 16646 / JW/IW-1228P) TaxID=555079 RepID=D9RYL6_THEOJ|nr:WecB/TagA/CpsF family glycosyltransferase [Thermosediminibacter oceani]ADL08440.1 glycosyl transferase, WecB/TagA/CpsF family [Thermosediminibacter oceani DSM 16646]
MQPDINDEIDIMGILLDRVDYYKASQRIMEFLESPGAKIVVTPNAEIIMAAQKNKKLKDAVNSADLSLPDGIGVVLASRLLGRPLEQRTTGFDLMMELLKMAADRKLSIFLLGGKPGVAEDAAKNIKKKFPGIRVAGTHHGYFDESGEEKVVGIINEASPDILFVAMGAPKQEIFMAKNRDKLRCRVAMGVGGSLDVLSGKVRRAPVFMQRAGLEWLYRLITQPSRFRRMSVLPLFLFNVIFRRGK